MVDDYPIRPTPDLEALCLRPLCEYATAHAEVQREYPITNEHGSLYYQLVAFKSLNPGSPSPVILNFDAHHDFYEAPDPSIMAVMSGTWAQLVTETGLAHVYTVLPCVEGGNQGGFGNQDWNAPRVVHSLTQMNQIDYQAAIAGFRTEAAATCELKDLVIDSVRAPLSSYRGPLWLSIDYDFFSLGGHYPHTLRELDKEFKLFRSYLNDYGIRPTEILGYRSPDYLTLYSGERGADRWVAGVDARVRKLREDFLGK
jgi:hypothetical protein